MARVKCDRLMWRSLESFDEVNKHFSAEKKMSVPSHWSLVMDFINTNWFSKG